jgi:ATP-binding cassette subfamily B protein RaxB
VIVLLSLLLQVFPLVSPLFMQLVIDEVVAVADRDLLIVLALGFALLLLVETFTAGLRQWVILALESRLGLQLSRSLLRHLLRLPARYFQNRSLGDVASRFAALDTVRQVFSNSVVTALVDGLLAVVCLVVMWRYSADLTLVVVAFLGLALAVRLILFPAVQQRSRQQVEAAACADSSFLESVRMIQAVKVQAAEDLRESHWMQRQVASINRQVSLSRLGIFHSTANNLLSGGQGIVVVCLGGLAILDGVLTVGMFFAYLSFRQRFCASVDALVGQVLELRLLKIHLERLSDILRSVPDRPLLSQPTVPWDDRPSQALSLETRNLAFSYSPGYGSIFRGLELTVAPGEIVAISGASGCGKSTLLKCLAGLFQPTEGSVVIGDNRRDAGPLDHRERLAAVMQDDTLFSGSLADNILCGDENPDAQRMTQCAEMACIHEEIMSLPMQYATPVGEGGAGLSGGQAQRLCIARALYRRPGLLLLDEAGSHLQPKYEARIIGALRRLGTTCILVAHRQETLAMADRVFRMPGA